MSLSRKPLEPSGDRAQYAVAPLMQVFLSLFSPPSRRQKEFCALEISCHLIKPSIQVLLKKKKAKKLLWEVTVVTGIQTSFLKGKMQN